MNLAWKEMKKSKTKFVILGSIVFLISLLTFIISGLANGLSQDNAALIKNLPDGTIYMETAAEETHALSAIDMETQQSALSENDGAFAFSIQMGFLLNEQDEQQSVAFATSTDSAQFPDVKKGEIILDRSLEEDGLKQGDIFTNSQLDGEFTVAGFTDGAKYSHAPVAFIHPDDFAEMYRTDELQMLFLPEMAQPGAIPGLQSFSTEEFLNTLPSYSAEQLSLSMIVWFLVVISGMLFAIFFYMMNIQKLGLYGILKAIGVKTGTLFRMIWTQMVVITAMALLLSIAVSQVFETLAPDDMPFYLPIDATLQLTAVFFVIGFAGATLSGLQIRKAKPLQAIQQGEG
ncbi:ABC transporter permease [Planococcus rifietoensis]|uniref:Putative hemin transport system permease protein HrtB n=1 Tax=Planococcus rifietoensis TaxID=200991 RepID=A0A0U2YRG7_9BACL|nr:ABC transporter permease [Planococcus rifietoensis]ALS75405.1 ABC transporter permease [Planococcus rifietoensis]